MGSPSAEWRSGFGAIVSIYTAMCWLTPRALAATVANDEHVRLAQTLNERMLPATGGVTRAGATALGRRGASGGADTPDTPVPPKLPSPPSTAAAAGPRPVGRPPAGPDRDAVAQMAG